MDNIGTVMDRVVAETASEPLLPKLLNASDQTTTFRPIASDNYIINRLSFMEATLPGRAIDLQAGQQRTAVYVKILRGHSRDAMTYMADEACARCEWFPTPKQCLEFLAEYREPVCHTDQTLLEARNIQAAFEQWLENVRNGQPLGDVEERWLRIAVEQGVVRRLADGSFVSRALYHGPKPYVEIRA